MSSYTLMKLFTSLLLTLSTDRSKADIISPFTFTVVSDISKNHWKTQLYVGTLLYLT
jgi:hypothetical protein